MAGWRVGRQMVIGVAVLGVLCAIGAVTPEALASLPDGRQYELVSPPQKHGGDVIPNSLRTWAADDGDAAVFSSLTGFGDVTGTGVATDYMATRVAGTPAAGSQGWTTHAISPPAGALPVPIVATGFEPMDDDFTPNLDTGVFQSFDPLTSDPNVAGVANLYLRRGLRSAPSPSVDLVSACPDCVLSGRALAPYTQTRFNMLPKFAGISTDGTHVLFESVLRLTSDAVDGTSSGQVNLYEYANGVLQNVGILPDGTPAASAVAGRGMGAGSTSGLYLPRALSQDGTRVAFMANPSSCTIGADKYSCGDLYVRDTSQTPATTVKVNTSERTPPDPAGPLPAVFWAMSTDGQRVLFTTNEQMTDDDTNTNVDLYEFDASAPPGSRLTRISVQDPSLSGADADVVVGASDDLRTVYFTSTRPLLPGDPALAPRAEAIYMWRDTGSGPPQLRFVAPLFADTIENRVAGAGWSIGEYVQSRVSPDGRYLLFGTPSGAGILSHYPPAGGTRSDYDQGTCQDVGPPGCRELYLYDADATTPPQQMQCVSCRPDGATATVSASDMVHDFVGGSLSEGILDHALSTDGRVFFTTAEPLVPEDVNGRPDAYEWENGQVHLLTGGQSLDNSYFLDASPDGADAFVVTRAQLTKWDDDDSYDLYDVRQPLPGHPAGVPDPPVPPTPCTPGVSCGGPLLQPPPLTAVPTVTFSSPGNLRQTFPRPLRCRAGTVRKRTSRGIRCVRRPRRKPARCPRSKVRGKKCAKAAVRGRKKGSAR